MKEHMDKHTAEICDSAVEMIEVARKVKGPAYVIAATAITSMQRLLEMVLHSAVCTDPECKVGLAADALSVSKAATQTIASLFSETDRQELFKFLMALEAKAKEVERSLRAHKGDAE